MIAEAPTPHHSVRRPSKPTAHKPSKPSKPTTPKTHEKHDAPSRAHKGGTKRKGTKDSTKKSAGLEERSAVGLGGGVLLHVASLGGLPN